MHKDDETLKMSHSRAIWHDKVNPKWRNCLVKKNNSSLKVKTYHKYVCK